MRLRRRTTRTDELRRVYRANLDAVFAFFSYSVDRASAEDLTSSTFERVVRAWDSFDPARAGERTWILAIARNQLVDHLRRRQVRLAVSVDEHPGLLDSIVDPDDDFERVLGPDELRRWLACLDERQRQVLALRFAGDLSTGDIADVLGLSSANVNQILSRSLRRLRREVGAKTAGQGQRSTERSTRRSR